MKLLVVFAFIGACVAIPIEEPNQEKQPSAYNVGQDLLPPPHIPDGKPIAPVGVAENHEPVAPHIPDGKPIAPVGVAENTEPVPEGVKPESSDLKTDATFWPSYRYSVYPSYRSSWQSPWYPRARSYSYYSPYRSYYAAPRYSYWL